MNKLLNDEVWERLLSGKSMHDLDIAKKDGRIDLSGLCVPQSKTLRELPVNIASVAQIDNSRLQVRNATWSDLDFTESSLQHVLLFNCSITNCVFDECDCRHWGFWDSTVSHSSFRKADLREAVFGGLGTQGGNGCFYSDINFSEANMRKTIYKVALFERCDFRNAGLANIDFQSSRFVDCTFAGRLDNVTFYRRGFKCEAFPPNEMENVDFSHARLRYVGFRGLTLDRVRLPQDSEHIVIKDFPNTLSRMVEILKRSEDPLSKKLVAFIGIDLKWAVPNQSQGVINTADLADVIGEEGVKLFMATIPR